MKVVPQNIVDYLVSHADHIPAHTAFTFTGNDLVSETVITYGELEAQVKMLAAQLPVEQLHGKNALLMYQHTRDFIIAFLACQYLGIVAVPVPFTKGNKQVARLAAIIDDAEAVAVFCGQGSVQDLQQGLPQFEGQHRPAILATDLIASAAPATMAPTYYDLSFIQYTSGSTGKPKGVMITAGNLLHNQQLIRRTFGCDKDSIIFSWLPFHHDMGLIGNILHTIYTGCSCVLMQPLEFMQSPVKWLEGISKYKATHSGGPNFAYDLCVERIPAAEIQTLDLATWKVAYNGSEPVKTETLQRFSDHFSAAGFRGSSFYPCYGLAEATLLVSGEKKDEQFSMNSAGMVAPGMTVKIIAVEDQHECADLEEGEICIGGDSVTSGYWKKDNSAIFYTSENGSLLRTGDLGCLFEGQLFVRGRLKEMLIVRGRNIYPYDIEEMVAATATAITKNGVAVIHMEDSEQTIILAEIKRVFLRDLDAENIINLIGNAVQGHFGITPYDILLLTPLSIPRTTSGKLQRLKCKDLYRNGGLRPIGAKLQSQVTHPALPLVNSGIAGKGNIKEYVLGLITEKNGKLPAGLQEEEITLTALGIDSMRAIALINTINNDLDINLDAAAVFRENSLAALIRMLENILWLKNAQTTEREIIL